MGVLGLRALAAAFPRIVPAAAPKLARFIPGMSEEAAAPAIAYGQRAMAPKIFQGYKGAATGGLRGMPKGMAVTTGQALRKYPKTVPSIFGMNMIGMPGGGDPEATGGAVAPEGRQYPLGIGGASALDDPMLRAQGAYNALTGEVGAGPGTVPDYMDLLTDPRITEYVDSTIARLQSPLQRQLTKRERGGGKLVKGIQDVGAESQRQGKALRKEDRVARDAYSKGAQERQTSTTDQLGEIADRLIGGSNVDEMFSKERGEQAVESIGRTGEAMARESSTGSGGSLDTSSLMSDIDAAGAMQTANDVKDAREQTRLDTDEINAKIADVANSSPDLARQFAKDMYDSEMNKYSADNDAYKNKLNALSEFYIAFSKQNAEGDKDAFDMNKWIGSKQKDSFATVETPTNAGGSVSQTMKPMAELQRDPQAYNAFLGAWHELTQGGANPEEAAEWLYGNYQQDSAPEWNKALIAGSQ